MKIHIIVAMNIEATYIINKLYLDKADNKSNHHIYSGRYKNIDIQLFVPQKNGKFEKIGTVQAAILAYKSIVFSKPDLILNVGTCGSIHYSDLKPLDLVHSKDYLIYHDRYTIDLFEEYSIGKFSCTSIKNSIGSKPVIFGTGNSLALGRHNWNIIKKYNVSCVDMESAAIAEICQEEGVKFFALKVVTDIVYEDKNDTASQFEMNFKNSMVHLSENLIRFFDTLNSFIK